MTTTEQNVKWAESMVRAAQVVELEVFDDLIVEKAQRILKERGAKTKTWAEIKKDMRKAVADGGTVEIVVLP